MFLYEILWNLLGAFIIIALERKVYLRWGKSFGIYLIWYGIGRSIFETYRLDPSETLLGIRTNVWAALAAIVVGIAIIAIQNRRHPGKEPSVYVEGRPAVKLKG